MEERKLNEQVSLKLITQMIQNNKKNFQLDRGNIFLLWGYLCSVTAIIVYILITITANPQWNWLWFAIPVIGWPISYWEQKKKTKPIVTYTDTILNNIWKIIGQFGIMISLLSCFYFNTLPLMLPLVTLLCSLGVAITGGIIKDKWMYNASGCGVGLGTIMMVHVLNPPELNLQYLGFAFCFFIMMVIPGHRLNNEAKRLCSKN